jgi:hypothetical protein
MLVQRSLNGGALVRGALAVNAAAATLLPLVFGGRSASLTFQAFSPYTIAALVTLIVLVVVRRVRKDRPTWTA